MKFFEWLRNVNAIHPPTATGPQLFLTAVPHIPALAGQPTGDSMSWLQTVGKDIKSVFSWLGSSKGQTVLAAGEGAALALGAPASIVNLTNYWVGKIITVESLAAAAGQQDGSGTTKAAAVLSDVTPEVLAIAKQNGLATPTADNIALANTKLVEFLNALGAAPATPTKTA